MVTILYALCSDARMDGALYGHWLGQLPPPMREQARRYRRWQDAQACLAGKVLLQKGLESLLGDADALPRIRYNGFGRPFLPDSDVDFNISHAGAYVVCALGGLQRVGIDLEQVMPVDVELFRTSMDPQEWNAVAAAPDQTQAFYEYWTRNEAVAKANGQGLALPVFGTATPGSPVWADGQAWHLQNVPFGSGYVCHLATSQPGPFRLTDATPAVWLAGAP